MTRLLTRPSTAVPVDVSKYHRDQKVWIYTGGTNDTPRHKLERLPGVVKRVDQASVAVLVNVKGLVVTYNATEAKRIAERVREQYQTQEPDFPIDEYWDVARFA